MGVTRRHFYTTTIASGTVNAVPRVNGQGKFTNGWDINGITTGIPTTTGVGSDGIRLPSYACPAGSCGPQPRMPRKPFHGPLLS